MIVLCGVQLCLFQKCQLLMRVERLKSQILLLENGKNLENQNYLELPCADPIEGRDYNPTAASILWGSTHKAPALISHAHGLTTVYRFERFEKIQSNKIGGK